MTRDNQIKGKQAGMQNQGRQKMDKAARAAEAGRSGGQVSHQMGTDNSDPVSGETRSKIGGGNEGGASSARPSDR